MIFCQIFRQPGRQFFHLIDCGESYGVVELLYIQRRSRSKDIEKELLLWGEDFCGSRTFEKSGRVIVTI